MRTVGSPKFLWSLVNLITLSRLVSGLISIWLSQVSSAVVFLTILFGYIFLSDLADGYFARRWGVQTKFGAVFDYVVDRFNIYVQIAVLATFGLPVWLFIPFLFRDMAYIFVQTYVQLDRVAGTKELSLISTMLTYIYVLLAASGFGFTLVFLMVLFISYLLSLGNFVVRMYRLRHDLREELRKDFGA